MAGLDDTLRFDDVEVIGTSAVLTQTIDLLVMMVLLAPFVRRGVCFCLSPRLKCGRHLRANPLPVRGVGLIM